MDPATIVIILGALIGIIAYVKYRSNMLVWGVAGIMILGGLFAPVYINDMFAAEEPVVTTVSGVGSFDLTPVNGSWPSATAGNACPVSIADDQDSCTVTLHVGTDNEEFQANYTSINFTIRPIAPVGADNTNLVTLTFAVDQTLQYGGEDIFYKSSNDYTCDWRVNGETTEDDGVGAYSMIYTDTDNWVEIRIRLDSGEGDFGEEMDTVGETCTIPVTFGVEGGSWSQTFDINLVLITLD